MYDEDTGNEDHPRDSTSALLLQPSVVSTNKHLLQPASGLGPPAKMVSNSIVDAHVRMHLRVYFCLCVLACECKDTYSY